MTGKGFDLTAKFIAEGRSWSELDEHGNVVKVSPPDEALCGKPYAYGKGATTIPPCSNELGHHMVLALGV